MTDVSKGFTCALVLLGLGGALPVALPLRGALALGLLLLLVLVIIIIIVLALL